jgi:hypothetical protein
MDPLLMLPFFRFTLACSRVAKWYICMPKIPVWRALEWELLIYFTAILNILWLFGVFCGQLVYFSHFGMPYHEKSGNLGFLSFLV